MKWVVGAIVVVGIAIAAGAVVQSKRSAKAERSTWTRAADAATSAASAAANGVKGAVTHT